MYEGFSKNECIEKIKEILNSRPSTMKTLVKKIPMPEKIIDSSLKILLDKKIVVTKLESREYYYLDKKVDEKNSEIIEKDTAENLVDALSDRDNIQDKINPEIHNPNSQWKEKKFRVKSNLD